MELVEEKFDVYKASAIQIRFKGFKGVLVVHNGINNLKDN
jgi:hypothetical protein